MPDLTLCTSSNDVAVCVHPCAHRWPSHHKATTHETTATRRQRQGPGREDEEAYPSTPCSWGRQEPQKPGLRQTLRRCRHAVACNRHATGKRHEVALAVMHADKIRRRESGVHLPTRKVDLRSRGIQVQVLCICICSTYQYVVVAVRTSASICIAFISPSSYSYSRGSCMDCGSSTGQLLFLAGAGPPLKT